MFLAPTVAVTDRQKILIEGYPRTIFLGKKILEIFFIGNLMKRREIMFLSGFDEKKFSEFLMPHQAYFQLFWGQKFFFLFLMQNGIKR